VGELVVALRLGEEALDAPAHHRQHQQLVDRGAARRLTREAPVDQVAQLGGEAARQRRVGPAQDLDDEAAHVLGVEGAAQAGHLVEQAAHAPHVRLCVVRLVVAYLGAHVVGRAAGRLRQLYGRVEDARDAKVAELEDAPVLSEEDVLRLDVAVEHLLVSREP
jgi:hypothetical protein